MRITAVNIPKTEDVKDGLTDIKMDRLGKIVLLAGKNGSGKSRILNKIISTLNLKPKVAPFGKSEDELKGFEKENKALQSQLRELKSKLPPKGFARISITKTPEINELEKTINNYSRAINSIKRSQLWTKITTNELSSEYTIVSFVPKRLEIEDNRSFSRKSLVASAASVEKLGLTGMDKGTYAQIQIIQDRWFNASHQNSPASTKQIEAAKENYERLKSFIETFLNATLSRNLDGDATLFGFPLADAKLSDGQIVLLQLCVAIYSQEVALKDVILVLDEPENHLHPSAIIETLDIIADKIPEGQIWIATHSIPILAHYDPSFIWYVENGSVQHAGKIPEKVLQSLLGGDDEIGKLQDFISLPAQLATARFAYQCLIEPLVLETGKEDPQTNQIRKVISGLLNDKPLRVLDYGAGKGRLLANLAEEMSEAAQKPSETIDYIAYDPFDDDKEHCEGIISKVYEDDKVRYFNKMPELLTNYDKESFDVVVLCNVLHEIDPKKWLALFSKGGSISQLLKDGGILLLVEDHQMPIGEKAYQKGFLVLDTPQIKDLFKITEEDKGFVHDDARGDGRLKAHSIPQACLTRIDETSRLEALKALSKHAQEKICEIRELDKNYANGRIHGFWVQQFANAQLNISEFTT